MLQGYLLNERYKIKRTIGGGGMANVYLATDLILNRDVAVKVLRMDYADDDEFIARFDREAQSATSLSHPNIVSIYDVGEEEQILFMVMEFVDGMTLKEYIHHYAPIDVTEALDIMKQIASAIAHAHANDIVHRDIKPQNILIDQFGHVKVTDFGIAVALSATALTTTNSILGSVHYLSPEQARGGMATKKSDIYSLGIVLFELLTGRLPFLGQSPVSIALKHLQHDTPSVRRFNPDVPQSVENVVLKATAKDPFHRYENVYDMEEGLDTALNPDKLDEEKYTPPSEAGEETKAIPIITDNHLQENVNDDTMVHHTNETTKNHQNDQSNNNGKRRRRKKWIISLGILFLLLTAGIASLFIFPNLFQPDDVIITDVAGMTYEEAMTGLRDDGLDTEREEAYSDDVEEGTVIRTDPGAGNTVKEEDTVTIVVSQGKESVTIDDYVGENFNQTETILEEKGYNDITADEEYSEEYNAGQITEQVHPSPDSEVIPSETGVIFKVSIGPQPISLSNLSGMTEQEAIDDLNGQGLSADIKQEHSDNIPEGQVIRQSPDSGTEMTAGDTVEVYISDGPEEEPPVNHTENITVAYNPKTESDNSETQPEQTVKIYIGDDSDRSIDQVADEYTITEDREFTISLTIAPDSSASYRVMRDDEVVADETITYEEVEGD